MVSSSTSLNFCSPVQAARSHPKCIGSLLASDGTDGCVGCEATPEQQQKFIEKMNRQKQKHMAVWVVKQHLKELNSKLSSTNCQTSSQQKAALA